ncbi:helix-turn-helix domain-containing protein [Baekduia sp.]|uniref:PucR family transcriptional regulator n=1 Tax=Baekduia sp. TaxID=2600305 RepID=UPI002E011DEB|nr:helix-turn-helix domain-containing protein [Baekduia sp.]
MESHEVRTAIVGVLRPTIGRLTDEVLASVVEAVPPFEEWWGGSFDVRDGVEQGIRGFLERLESGAEDRLPGHDVFFDFGRGELRAGRSVGSVLAAYRVAAQAAWRGMADTGHDAGIEPRALYGLADAIFAYIDQLCAATVEGYAYEQSMAAVERVDARRRLVELAVRQDGRGLSAPELAGAAADAGWRLPARLAVVAFRDERVARVASRLPPDALVARVDGTGWAIVGDPDGPGRRATVQQGLTGVRAGVGPAVAAVAAAESARLAERSLALALGAPGPVWADDRRVDLLLLGDPGVAQGLVDDILGPLALAPDATRERLVETLGAWLEHQGEVRPTAQQLHVHTQTVRYRVAQLRELLGDRMGTAEGRLELELALRARSLAAPGPPFTPASGPAT